MFRARTRPRGSGCRAAVSRFERGADGFAQVLTALYASDLVTELTISAHDRDRDRAPPPGIFRLFAIGELVGYKPCAILT